METLLQAQIKEAVGRMEMMDMHKNAIREIQDDPRVINKSIDGILYWLDEKEEKEVQDFEEKHGAFVYHVILTNTEFGLLKSLLYVPKTKTQWARERKELQDGYAFAYVINEDTPMYSEFGTIGIGPSIGGLMRWA